MLDRTSKRILRFIVKSAPDKSDGLFSLEYVAKCCRLEKGQTYECVRFLDELGLIDFIPAKANDRSRLYGFTASHKGRHYAEISRLDLCNSLLHSVLLPILVSFITALLVSRFV